MEKNNEIHFCEQIHFLGFRTKHDERTGDIGTIPFAHIGDIGKISFGILESIYLPPAATRKPPSGVRERKDARTRVRGGAGVGVESGWAS